ncbi:MAG: hypothetical protein HYY17_11275 [Planctomycetes bacterium]|nr:hypothetical protein [Planctomycetota bacterium]
MPQRPQDIPTAKLDAAFAEVTTMKAFVHATIHGFEKSGGFDAQVVWRAPFDLRVRSSRFEFACGEGRFQLWIPDEKKFIRGSLDDFRKSERGALIHLFQGVLPRRPKFIAFASKDLHFYGIAEDSVVRFSGTTPVDRTGAVHVRYEEMADGVPVQVVARTDSKALHVAMDPTKLKTNVPVRDELFEMSPPEGAIVEEFSPKEPK